MAESIFFHRLFGLARQAFELDDRPCGRSFISQALTRAYRFFVESFVLPEVIPVGGGILGDFSCCCCHRRAPMNHLINAARKCSRRTLQVYLLHHSARRRMARQAVCSPPYAG